MQRMERKDHDADAGHGSGFALREAMMQGLAGRAQRADQEAAPPLFFTPFVSSPMRIDPGWIDYNGHLNMAYYGVLFDRAVDEAFLLCGMGPDYPAARGHSYFVVESRMRYRREIGTGNRVRMTLQLLEVDDKRIRYVLEMRDAEGGWLAATSEQLALHVNMASRKAAPFPPDVRAALDTMRNAHAALPAPEWAGQGVSMPEAKRAH